ncbi:MAG: ABC-2 type transport system permease protein [Saprospiraceae bacterium]|jgi:ABC-2 type transport system permease protein
MNKLWLIIKREYITRVTKKSFILATLLTPFAIAAFIAIVALIFSYDSGQRKIAVINESGLEFKLKDTKKVYFDFTETPLDELKLSYQEDGYTGVLYLPEIKDLQKQDVRVTYFSEDQISIGTKEFIQREIADKIREIKIDNSEISRVILESFSTNVNLEEVGLSVNDSGEIQEEDKTNSAGIATAMGMVMGFAIYMFLFFYGSMVMRSVMEEKMTRIVEVMISSVKPFQLMLGKIVGVGGVGLTQILIWAILIPTLNFIVTIFLPIDPEAIQSAQMSGAESEDMMIQVALALESVKSQNWALILPMFIFYFLGGYFIYSALFAAVGSAIGDDLGESQSLTLPITIPVILAIYIAIAVIENPTSNLATFASIFPLFSPIVMPARLPFNPPVWEIVASVVVMIASVVLFIWLSGRIYRVGILLYGKKVTLRELGKWMFYKE